MEKRKLEKLGIETSLLGFGCMRFPTTPDGKIDEAEAERMMDKAIASGVTILIPLILTIMEKVNRL
ncbi:hypothetical protein [Eisenbergiella tayi]|uniref:hypothetical protein n=1 Tax=Eisenbergiella tayi TaxID=1432052 RepID=UPI00307BF361